MGFTPQEVRKMSLWQFFSALNGYIEANSTKSGTRLSDDEADELFDWIERDSDGPRELTTQTYWWEGERLIPMGIVSFRVQ